MINMERLLLSLVIILTAVPPISAENYSGKSSAIFLEHPMGARGAGMGEAFVVLSNDVNSLWWNPAGLIELERYDLMLMHDEYIQNINQEYIAFGAPLRRGRGSLGFAFQYLDYGTLQRTTITSGNAGQATGSFGTNSWAGTIGYANTYKRIQYGFSTKYVQEKIDQVTGYAIAFDAGLKYRVNSYFGVGYSLQNLGTKIKFEQEEMGLPLTHRFGLGYYHPHGLFNIEADAVKSDNDDWQMNLGGELWTFDRRFVLRSGFTSGRDLKDRYTVGAGFYYKSLALDYAFTPFDKLGSSHKASLQIKFGLNESEARLEREESSSPAAQHPENQKTDVSPPPSVKK